MTIACELSPLARWDRRFGKRRCGRARPWAALGYLVAGPVVNDLVEVENLLLVAVYDEPQPRGRLALRLAGFSGRRVPWGVQWGGAAGSRFFKDLRLRPRPAARGQRLDATRTGLLRLALLLDRQLQRHACHPWLGNGHVLQLPQLWAGFVASRAANVIGGGPELAALCRQTQKTPDQLLAECRRHYEGLTLWPLEWVSHHWPDTAAVFADLENVPRWQVFAARRLPADLQGYRDAAQYDFFHSRFRPVVNAGRATAPRAAHVAG